LVRSKKFRESRFPHAVTRVFGTLIRTPVRRMTGRGKRVGADELLLRVAGGDQRAFEDLYTLVSGPVFGLVKRVVRDPAQSEEVAQEVLLELWRSAGRFDPGRGSALAWVLTLAHRRAVDRVRSARAAVDREQREALRAQAPAYDQVAEEVEAGLEREWVRRCLNRLTALQRQSVTLAYYDGYTYREVAERLSLPLGTVKTRMRDGLTRLRDCLGGAA
jgi:RNA polymerase sigma-70 factor (ECF subfamily)